MNQECVSSPNCVMVKNSPTTDTVVRAHQFTNHTRLTRAFTRRKKCEAHRNSSASIQLHRFQQLMPDTVSIVSGESLFCKSLNDIISPRDTPAHFEPQLHNSVISAPTHIQRDACCELIVSVKTVDRCRLE